jgi:hypothetical protein
VWLQPQSALIHPGDNIKGQILYPSHATDNQKCFLKKGKKKRQQ